MNTGNQMLVIGTKLYNLFYLVRAVEEEVPVGYYMSKITNRREPTDETVKRVKLYFLDYSQNFSEVILEGTMDEFVNSIYSMEES